MWQCRFQVGPSVAHALSCALCVAELAFIHSLLIRLINSRHWCQTVNASV